jgi:hypothetical protein
LSVYLNVPLLWIYYMNVPLLLLTSCCNNIYLLQFLQRWPRLMLDLEYDREDQRNVPLPLGVVMLRRQVCLGSNKIHIHSNMYLAVHEFLGDHHGS